MSVVWALFFAAWSCNPVQIVGKETTFICVKAFDREIPERYPDEQQCNAARDRWKQDSRPDLLIMHTASCVSISAPLSEAKKK